MSHLPERKEKICLNCKSVIYGRYCHVCGQENTEPRETLWGLITHFVYDITHFDGKFFETTKYLLFRPGYLALEYLRGRRASYLNPIRMYIFTSAFFFILFFAFFVDNDTATDDPALKKELIAERTKLEKEIAVATDSTKKKKLTREWKQLDQRIKYFGQAGIIRIANEDTDTVVEKSYIFGGPEWPRTVAEYDSLQGSLPEGERDGWLWSAANRRMITINEKYGGNGKEFWRRIKEKFNHSLPQMMFVSLPLVALILQLLYLRRKQYYYVNHLIVTVNIYIAVFLLLLVFYGFSVLYSATGMGFFRVLAILTYFSIFLYVYKTLRNFYRQRRLKTMVKFLLFLCAFTTLMLFLMSVYFFTSAFQI